MGGMKLEASRLRDELQRITDRPLVAGETLNEWFDKQMREVDKLRGVHRHSIGMVAREENPSRRHNCFSWAFGIEEDERPLGGRVYPTSPFVAAVLRDELIRRVPDNSDSAVFAIYFQGDRPTHAGKVMQDRTIVSKWGGNASHVWSHLAHEVPTSYGDGVRVYGPFSSPPAELFAEWVKRNT